MKRALKQIWERVPGLQYYSYSVKTLSEEDKID